MPCPGDVAVFTRRYASGRVLEASVRPSREASCLSGRMATRLPPPFTQVVNIVTWDALSDISPRIATS